MFLQDAFRRLQSTRGSMQWLLRPPELQLIPCISICQRRTRIMPPPYREQNLEEKAMKKIDGVSVCPTNCLCSQNIEITYKNTRLLSQFTSQQTGCILPRTITKVCMLKQRRIAKEIKKARTMCYMPYTESLLRYHKDPKLFHRSRAREEMLTQIHYPRREKTGRYHFQPYPLGND